MSATTTGLPPDVESYLAEVRDALRDLPADERDDLLAEVEVSLLDAAAEGGGARGGGEPGGVRVRGVGGAGGVGDDQGG